MFLKGFFLRAIETGLFGEGLIQKILQTVHEVSARWRDTQKQMVWSKPNNDKKKQITYYNQKLTK